MERNVAFVQHSEALRSAARALVERAVQTATTLGGSSGTQARVERGGRKADGIGLQTGAQP